MIWASLQCINSSCYRVTIDYKNTFVSNVNINNGQRSSIPLSQEQITVLQSMLNNSMKHRDFKQDSVCIDNTSGLITQLDFLTVSVAEALIAEGTRQLFQFYAKDWLTQMYSSKDSPLPEMLQQQEKKETASLKATTYFNEIQKLPFSSSLEIFLDTFRNPKELILNNFIEGIQKFTAFANMNYEQRESFFGNPFHGLHYSSDLTELWNEHHSNDNIQYFDIPYFVPSGWRLECSNSSATYEYQGQDLAAALDKLVHGPVIIDCIMFSQISMLFGIRYMLGDELFNKVFHRKGLCIHTDYSRLKFEFVDWYESNPEDSVFITQVPNNSMYRYKHPGGFYDSHTCVVINGLYHTFDPVAPKNTDMEKEEVEDRLREMFNRPLDIHDKDKCNFYLKNPTDYNPRLKEQTGVLAAHAQLLADTEYTREEHQALCDARNRVGNFSFNMEKFQRWVWNKVKKQDVSLISNSIFTQSDYSMPIEQLNMTVNQLNQSYSDRYVIKRSKNFASRNFWYITDKNGEECGILFAEKKGNLLSETDYSKRAYKFIAKLQAKEIENNLKSEVPKLN